MSPSKLRKREHIRALFLRKPTASSATTDDIPSQIDSDTGEASARGLTRHASAPSPLFVRRSSTETLASIFTISAPSTPGSMSGTHTITYDAQGVQPPVYVVTSMSNPPWVVLEMQLDASTETGRQFFSRTFEGVPAGEHQYKIRIGDHGWVIDDTHRTTTDSDGNHNNVVDVVAVESDDTSAGASALTEVSTDDASSSKLDQVQEAAHDASPETKKDTHLATVPIPITVVEKVDDQPQPEYGDNKSTTLTEDAGKRAADAEPDVETMVKESPQPSSEATSSSPSVPTVPDIVLVKSDNKPSHGHDFGVDATSSQKLAHEQRAADAEPDEIIIVPDTLGSENLVGHSSMDTSFADQSASEISELDHVEPGTPEEQEAPLLPHERELEEPRHSPPASPPASPQASTPIRRSTDKLDIIEEESSEANSSVLENDKDEDESDADELDELELAPRLDHEHSTSIQASSVGDTVSIDDVDNDIEDGTFELQQAPTFAYETAEIPSDAPPFSYEVSTVSSTTDTSTTDSLSQASDEDDVDVVDDFDTSLLPHEKDHPRASQLLSSASSASDLASPTDEPESEEAKLLFTHEGTNFQSPFHQEQRRSFTGLSRIGTTGSLPHALPRSDEEDPDLLDPSTEAFPTNRAEILERVSTIRGRLPEDNTYDSPIHSPAIESNACSSVDLSSAKDHHLGPVPSNLSLSAVVEEDDLSDEEKGSPVSEDHPEIKIRRTINRYMLEEDSTELRPHAMRDNDYHSHVRASGERDRARRQVEVDEYAESLRSTAVHDRLVNEQLYEANRQSLLQRIERRIGNGLRGLMTPSRCAGLLVVGIAFLAYVVLYGR